MSEGASGDGAAEAVRLPEPVRQRVMALAAERLGELAESDVPPTLRRVARFTPAKRGRLAGVALAAAIETDPGFRNSVAESLRAALPELASGLASGSVPAAADPYDVAAAAYLLRSAGWERFVAAAAQEADRAAATSANRDASGEVDRLSAELAQAQAGVRQERDKHKAQTVALTAQLDEVRRALRQAVEAQRRSEDGHRASAAERDSVRAAAERSTAKAAAELRRVRARVTELEEQLEQVRKSGRGSRTTDDVRLWLLLDSVANAAAGLRRELALPPAGTRPADEVAARLGNSEQPVPAALGLAREDPAWLDALLGVPGTHLLVDGYNVTKTGFPDVSLEAQRGRLVQGLAVLATRTSAEVTVVFDGAERTGPLGAPSGRGVRVLFSPAGRTADDVLVQLVRAEPAGRPVAVVSADREVVTRAERAGARGVPPVALLGLLGRS